MNAITIMVRDFCGTYIARAVGLNLTASCTSLQKLAAERVAEKAAKKLGCKVLKVECVHGDTVFRAELSEAAS